MNRHDDRIAQLRAVRRRFSTVLMAWAVASIAAGVILWFGAYTAATPMVRPMIAAVAAQMFIWGAIESLFAAAGFTQLRRPAVAAEDDPIAASEQIRDTQNLIRALLFSARLNYAWVAAAVLLLVLGVAVARPMLTGHGIGILVQSVFLWIFDRAYLRALRVAA